MPDLANHGGTFLVTRLMAVCLENHANHMRARAEKSVMAIE